MGGEAGEREATPEEVETLIALLRESLDAGGLGLSTTRSSTHIDGDAKQVPSRAASEEELLSRLPPGIECPAHLRPPE